MLLPYKRIISESLTMSLQQRLNKLEDWIEDHGGDDLVRWLHAQEVEITSHTSGAVLKCYRTDTEYDAENVSENWRFWAGRYEIDIDEFADAHLPEKLTKAPGFTHRDYYWGIKHIIEMHEEGKLKQVPKRALVVTQITGSEELPNVRSYRTKPRGRMVVVGLRYDVEPGWVENNLRFDRPNQITQQALEKQQQWESHSQVQRISDMLDTDSMPLLFRGRLQTADRAISGMEKSITADKSFRGIVQRFFTGLPENPSDEDYDQFFREAVHRFGDLEVRRLDHEDKVKDATVITQQAFRDNVDHARDRYTQADDNLQQTIDQYGHSSDEHNEDFKNTQYMKHWVKTNASHDVFADPSYDPVTNAVLALQNADMQASETNVASWIMRELQEKGIEDEVYQRHLQDKNVPEGRHLGKSVLSRKYAESVRELVRGNLDQVVQDLADHTQTAEGT